MKKGVELAVNSPKDKAVTEEPIVYFSQKTLIDNYWVKKKTEIVHLKKEMSAEEYETSLKEKHIEEAKKLYPHKGRYILQGTVLTYIGDM